MVGQTHKHEGKYLWMSGGEIGARVGQGREQSNLGTMQRWGGAGESKRKEFKYSNFKNSCPCKITEMKAEIQLVEEAAITCSYCQSNAHSRIVQPLCKLDCYVQICSVPLLHGAEDWKPWAAQSFQMAFQGSHVFHSQTYRHMLGPHCLSAGPGIRNTPGLWGRSRIRPSDVDRVHPPPTSGVFWVCQVCERYADSVQLLHPKGNPKALKLPRGTFGRL